MRVMRAIGVLAVGLLGASWGFADVPPSSIPAAIFADPPRDAVHPAKSTVLHIPSHGVLINGLLYSPSGLGPHPTLVICHGLPGNEKNLDLAQAVRRAGWNAVTFNYRGSWGSPGVFRFRQNIEDAAAVLAYLRLPATAAELGIDTRRLAIAGHSMGGWVTVQTAAHDPGLIGAILISAADIGGGSMPMDKLTALMADNMETLAGVTARSMAEDVQEHTKGLGFAAAAGGLARMPLLVMTADDGLAPDADALVGAIKAKGGSHVTAIHVATDHSWSDQRIAMQVAVLNWLASLTTP